ncbi:hypothetical protein LB543_19440 [Mesorhizobium sp. ESP7-2]|nr:MULTISPECIES: hypothetical protein [unclassified Mesorhizobium]MBZ9708897.1 hypothetical protein [Mesorhizobium sp. ESP7-2]
MIKTAIVYLAAAFFEIAGCFSFWTWVREGRAGGGSRLVLRRWHCLHGC